MSNEESSPAGNGTTIHQSGEMHAQRSVIGAGFRIVSLFTLLSRVLGLVRDMLMASLFGAGPVMDAFSVAFRIPNLARRLFGEGALTTAYLPVFLREWQSSDEDSQNRLSTAMFLIMAILLIIGLLLLDVLLAAVYFALPIGPDGKLLIQLTVEMLPFAVLTCLMAQLSAVLHSMHRFGWPAFAPVFLNIVWITIASLVAWLSDDHLVRVHVIALSVVISGFVQLGVVGAVVWQAGIRYSANWRRAIPQVREVFRTMMPIIMVTWVVQLNTLFDSLLAWGLAAPAEPAPSASGLPWPLETGTASALYFAQRMYQFPLGVFGVALATVLFPLLSKHAERGELAQVGRDLTYGMRLVIAIGVPASVGLGLLCEPIAVLFFERGAFTSEDASLTARCIAAYGAGVWAYIGVSIIQRGFFALGDRKRPMYVGLVAVGVNVVLNLTLIWNLAGMGLAVATAIASSFQFIATVWLYQQHYGLLDLQSLTRTSFKTGLSTGVMTVACLAVMAWRQTNDLLTGRFANLMIPFVASIAAYLLVARVLGLREPFDLMSRRMSTDA
ncbi:MAG: murein biosynthesis integral membrane protein MurJ [Planctomycetaceae bacterium]|nr:murein biosynthesis integral membrane protein MurJ [Planctomycetaceae bacterium]